MIKEFNKFIGFKILNWFVENPTKEIHIKGLARTLNISSSTSKYYCDLFTKDNILTLVKIANLNLFRLNNISFYVKELKKTLSLVALKEAIKEKIAKKAISIAIYGSYASGEYNENSDLDILIIGKNLDIDKDFTIKLEKKLKREIQLTIMSYPEFEKMKEISTAFVKEILSNHILIKGAKL